MFFPRPPVILISKFDANKHQIFLEANATIANGIIQLTNNQRNVALSGSLGRATYIEPLHLWDKETGKVASFSSNFSFSINSENITWHADGIAFFLAPNGTTIPSDSAGERLGLQSPQQDPSNSTSFDAAFVAVEFDTFVNVGQLDPNYTHIGIDVNSLKSAKTAPWSWNDIENGGKVRAVVTYESSSMTFGVVLTDDAYFYSSQVSTIVNLTEHLPEWVTFGFSATTGSAFEIHSIYSWSFSSNLEIAARESSAVTPAPEPAAGTAKGNGNNRSWIWAVTALSALVLAGVITFVIVRCRRLPNKLGFEDDDDVVLPIDEEFEKVAAGPKKFSYKELIVATDNFAEERLLGEGGFGKVYEGYLRNTGSKVAVKKITPESSQGLKEYAAEVKVVSQLRHRSLVQLCGWCHRNQDLLLVYEYMSNGSLDSHLFKNRSLLTWETRYKIAQDMASALLYLHEEWEQCVVHRDIKTSNIMLDSSFTAKLGDFGLARFMDHAKGSQTTVLAGTVGYMAPECLYTGKASKESDVYSFGVVLLEIACGRRVFEPRAENGRVRLVDWIWELYGTGNLLDAAEPLLGDDFEAGQMERLMIVGLWCVHPDCSLRPLAREAMSALKFDLVPPIIIQFKMPTLMYSSSPSNISAMSFGSRYNGESSSTTESSAFTSSSKSSTCSSSALLSNAQ